MHQQILTIKYNIERPVPLADFVKSLGSLEKLQCEGDLQLCIKEIRKGSYIFDLVSQIPNALAAVMPTVMEQTKNLSDFATNLTNILNFFKSGERDKEDHLPTRPEAIAAYDVVLPLTVDSRSNLEINNVNGDVHVYNYTEANAIQNSARRYIEDLDRTTGDIKQKVSLQWKTLSDNWEAGNKAVIPDIHSRTVVTKFATESIHQSMVRKVEFPFEHLWEVNVHVEWHGDIPKRYVIVDVVEDLGET